MSKIIKLVILIAGAVLVALIVRLVVQAATAPRHAPPVLVKRVQVAAADLPPGLLLRDADLAWKEFPVASIPPNAVTDSKGPGAVDLKGALLRQAVPAGQPIRSDEVISPDASGFLAATLKPGMRAVSVAIDDVSGNAGLIEPGDYVDLLLTQQMSGRTDNPELAVSSETVVQHVRVLAVGSVTQRPKTDGGTQDSFIRARTVTLEVTPRMAEVVSVAARLGSLSLALRSFAITSRDPEAASADAASAPAPIWAGDISRAVRELPRPRTANAPVASGGPTVMIYRGSQKSPAEDLPQPAGQVPPLPPQLMPH